MTTATKSKPNSKPETPPADTLESLRDFAQSIGLTSESLGKPIDGLLEQSLSEDDARQFLGLFAPVSGTPVDADDNPGAAAIAAVPLEDVIEVETVYIFPKNKGTACEIEDYLGIDRSRVVASFNDNWLEGQQFGGDLHVAGSDLLNWIRGSAIPFTVSATAAAIAIERREAQTASIEAGAVPKPEPKTAVEKGLAQARKWDAEAEDDGASEKNKAMDRYVIAMLRKENPQDGDVFAIAGAGHFLGLTSSQIKQDEKTIDSIAVLVAQHADRKDAEAALIDANEKRRSLSSRYREMERQTRNAAAEASSRFSLAAGAKAKLEKLRENFPHLFAEDVDGDLPTLRIVD